MTHQEKVDHVLDNFDFDRVSTCVRALGWTWASAAEGIPSGPELRARARAMLNELQYHAQEWWIGCCGFWAGRSEDGCYELRFTISEFDTHYEIEGCLWE